jgi:hypothetical protein
MGGSRRCDARQGWMLASWRPIARTDAPHPCMECVCLRLAPQAPSNRSPGPHTPSQLRRKLQVGARGRGSLAWHAVRRVGCSWGPAANTPCCAGHVRSSSCGDRTRSAADGCTTARTHRELVVHGKGVAGGGAAARVWPQLQAAVSGCGAGDAQQAAHQGVAHGRQALGGARVCCAKVRQRAVQRAAAAAAACTRAGALRRAQQARCTHHACAAHMLGALLTDARGRRRLHHRAELPAVLRPAPPPPPHTHTYTHTQAWRVPRAVGCRAAVQGVAAGSSANAGPAAGADHQPAGQRAAAV